MEFDEFFWREAFKQADKNKDGRISMKEFQKYMLKHGQAFSKKEVQKIFEICDLDNNGYIDFNEFVKFMKGEL